MMTLCFCHDKNDYFYQTFYFCSLYKEEKIDGAHSGVKWTCPNIHDLQNILEKIQIDKILQTVFDKRLMKIEDIPSVQLKEECSLRNLSTKGKKVLIRRLH